MTSTISDEDNASSGTPPASVYRPNRMKWKHHVYLSHRSADMTSHFVDHLYYSLTQAGIFAFKGDDLHDRGSFSQDELFWAIEESRLSLVVFSQTYVNSVWCLDELVKIMECREETTLVVVPVFFDVDPSEVRGLGGNHVDLAKGRNGVREETVLRWKKALTEAANLSGWILQGRDEQASIEQIVRDVSDKLTTASTSFVGNLFGIAPQIKQVDNLLKLGSSEVLSLGIWGKDGIGKTTIAKVVYERISREFEARAFIAEAGEKFGKDGLASMELELPPNIPLNRNLTIHSEQSSSQAEGNVWNRKTLLVLDGVDSVEQLEVLPALFERLGPGSRVIITTRHKEVLSRVHIGFKLKGLEMHAALQLFSSHAFKQNQPVRAFKEVSNLFVQIAAGSPLALENLAANLYQRSLPEWQEAFSELKGSPFPESKNVKFDEVSANVGVGGREGGEETEDGSDNDGADGAKDTDGNENRAGTILGQSLEQEFIVHMNEHSGFPENDSASTPPPANKHELPIMIATAVVEAASACFEQLQCAKLALVMASFGLFLCLGELTCKAVREQARFERNGFLPWLYSRHPDHRLFGTTNLYFGLLAAIWQTCHSAVGYSYACKNLPNPIQMNITMFLFSLFLIIDKLVNK